MILVATIVIPTVGFSGKPFMVALDLAQAWGYV